MTDAEKQRMLTVVRAAEFLFSENLALKTVLISHRIAAWEQQSETLMKDPRLSPQIRAKFQHLYDEIEQAHDETKALEALLQALPKPRKEWN
jgi:hypothetical protein